MTRLIIPHDFPMFQGDSENHQAVDELRLIPTSYWVHIPFLIGSYPLVFQKKPIFFEFLSLEDPILWFYIPYISLIATFYG
jgi:hypothetical protein